MPEIATIIVAVVVSGLSLIGTIWGSRAGAKEAIAVVNVKIDQLEKTVSKHNSVIERTYKLEQRCEMFDEKLKVANHRIDDLEGDKG